MTDSRRGTPCTQTLRVACWKEGTGAVRRWVRPSSLATTSSAVGEGRLCIQLGYRPLRSRPSAGRGIAEEARAPAQDRGCGDAAPCRHAGVGSRNIDGRLARAARGRPRAHSVKRMRRSYPPDETYSVWVEEPTPQLRGRIDNDGFEDLVENSASPRVVVLLPGFTKAVVLPGQ